MRAAILSLALLGAVLVTIAAAPKDEKHTGIFTPLEKGQTVSVKDVAGRYQIGVVPGLELAQKVIEVGPDFVVLEDASGLVQTRIPVYSIRAVTVTKLPKK